MLKRTIDDLKILDGQKQFEQEKPVGQIHIPDRSEFDVWMKSVMQRRYFTNHGPLVGKLEEVLRERLDVEHAYTVTNGTVGLMVALVALDIKGEVLVPSFTFPATVEALKWAKLTPRFVDVDPRTHMISRKTVEEHINVETSAVLGVHVWGRACDPEGLQSLCKEKGLKLIYDACHGFACDYNSTSLARFGDVSVYSMHATKVVNAAEGGVVVTRDDALAARINTVRNFHRTPADVEVEMRMNGKMSELQAAMALMALGKLEQNVERNKTLYYSYINGLASLAYLKPAYLDKNGKNNFQYSVFELSEDCPLSRDQLVTILRAEGVYARRYFYPCVHRLDPYRDAHNATSRVLPNSEALAEKVFQLPSGAQVSLEDTKAIIEILRLTLNNAGQIAERIKDIPVCEAGSQ
ncbi:DegT/DnrJ/EryC1/StrS aminotransferase family protein [Thalassospira sp. HJ]|uniref:DegT/DnrJ/EryC1/StrS family aminotransferase n=1 Tax=Thalassospira sp. HJ TaxID=1616823 RepID=UPI00069686B7|nr:DegT/DnrJ/EryC1/StrS family aminotransferase [Thalassospira sp. HJ]